MSIIRPCKKCGSDEVTAIVQYRSTKVVTSSFHDYDGMPDWISSIADISCEDCGAEYRGAWEL